MTRALLLVALTLTAPRVHAEGCRRAHGVRVGELAPCAGVLLPTLSAKRCARSVVDLRACEVDREEWRRRAMVPLPVACTPTTITIVREIEKPRPLWLVPVAVTIGVIAGAVSAWRILQ